jgi:hypothetical protein
MDQENMIHNLVIDLRNHKGMKQKTTYGNLYSITIKGTLNQSIYDKVEDITVIQREDGETTLKGVFIDQSALRGFLEQLWNLNITILSVKKDG